MPGKLFFRNRLPLMIFLLIPLISGAQEVIKVSTGRIAGNIPGELVPVAVSPDGNQILISKAGFKGLHLYDIRNGRSVEVTGNSGTVYKPVFSGDGNRIWYRADEFSGMIKYSSLNEYDILSGKTRIIEPKTRNLSPPVAVKSYPVYTVGGKQKSDPAAPKSADGEIFVMLQDLVPVIYINGIGKPLRPNGEGNYIWASLSPDKTRLLYNYQGTSTFVCDLEGKILASAGRINAPEWLTNNIIVGMNDKDDGYRVLSSDIICYSLVTGKTTNLTGTEEITEMYPVPFPAGTGIVYQTLRGELYLMQVRIK